MAKRFIDTAIWVQNKWFRKLKPKDKLLWFYLICNCDPVGVWEEDLELASFIIGEDYTKDEVANSFGDKLKWFNGKKLWIVDFCHFQYGTLTEENTTNKPHQSYISLLRKHSLWIDYTKTMHSLKEKEKEKDIDKDKGGVGVINIPFETFWNLYDKKVDRAKCEPKWVRLTDKEREDCIRKVPVYIAATPDKKFRRDPETYLNNKSWENEIISGINNNTANPKMSTKYL